MKAGEMERCCICRKWTYSRETNDAWPIKEGRCCPECNMDVVVPARLKMLSPKAYLHRHGPAE